MIQYRPLIQGKLDVLSQAGLSKDDFSKADSTFMKVTNKYSVIKCKACNNNVQSNYFQAFVYKCIHSEIAITVV